jgi:hypothetical protein
MWLTTIAHTSSHRVYALGPAGGLAALFPHASTPDPPYAFATPIKLEQVQAVGETGYMFAGDTLVGVRVGM